MQASECSVLNSCEVDVGCCQGTVNLRMTENDPKRRTL